MQCIVQGTVQGVLLLARAKCMCIYRRIVDKCVSGEKVHDCCVCFLYDDCMAVCVAWVTIRIKIVMASLHE